MWTSLLEKFGEGFADHWNFRMLTPTFSFWVGGGIIIFLNLHPRQLLQFANYDSISIIILILGFLFLLSLSQSIVQALILPILHIFEGYWGRFLGRLRVFFTTIIVVPDLEKKEKRWQFLADGFVKGNLDNIEIEEYGKLDAELLNYPVPEFQNPTLMPTVLGNIVRAGEQYPNIRYGLQMSVVFPRLWLVLPESVQKEITEVRDLIDRNTEWMIWSILFAMWCFWGWYAVVISIIASFIIVQRIVASTKIYALLVRSAFDDYRFDLYRSLNLPLPKSSKEEIHCGKELTSYLSRGSLKIINFDKRT